MRKFICLLIASCLLTACQESLEDKCVREAKEYTEKKCPAPIGKDMVIDSMTFDRATHTLHYYYTLSGHADNSELTQTVDVYDILLEQIKNATSVKEYKDAGYSFSYTYRSAKDKTNILFEYTFTQEDYL